MRGWPPLAPLLLAALLAALVAALVAIPARHAQAEPFIAGSALDQTVVADVAAAALAFMAPRTLEAIPLSQLSLWGLRGLATLDPRLSPELRDGQVRLLLIAAPMPRLLAGRASPDPSDAAAWGGVVADLVRAAWDASLPVRRVGTNGVIEVFFDEICNHLDPYSRYATPNEASADRDERSGRASIGLDVAARDGGYVIGTVVPNGPAAMAGVRAGEALLAIDGEALDDATPQDVAALLAGAEDTSVILELRGRDRRARTVMVTRTVLLPETVTARWSGKMLLVRVSGFASDTGLQLARTLSGMPTARKAPRGIVIDLRGNRGGLLRQAVAAAETMVASGIVAVTVGRDPAANHEFHAAGEDLARGLPVVVLVDGRSASAAEILAAALADQRRAVVVGSGTVGKGLVQAVEPLPNDGELLLTWSRVLAPLGWPIQGLGVLPQVCTSLGAEATTAQLAALAKGEQTMADALARHRAARAPVSSAETLEIRAACPAAEGRDGDLAAARYLVDHPDAYQTALLAPPAAPPQPP